MPKTWFGRTTSLFLPLSVLPFPNVQITQPKLPQTPPHRRPLARATERAKGEIFHLVHPLIFSNCRLGWDCIGPQLVGRSGCISVFPLQTTIRSPAAASSSVCNSYEGTKLGECVDEKDGVRWDKNRTSKRWKNIIRTSKHKHESLSLLCTCVKM